MKKLFYPLLLLFLLSACTNEHDYDLIKGKWKCKEWSDINKTYQKCDGITTFEFFEDKTYFSNVSGVLDTGTYKIEDGIIHFQPHNKLEIAVLIDQLDENQLNYLMNSSGIEEILKLEKVQ